MTYDALALACEQLSYRDKLRLAQLLIQLARKEEENANPQNRSETKVTEKAKSDENPLKDVNVIEYVIERLLKLKPSRKQSLINSIKAMFQFQGGISDPDLEKIISELQAHKYIRIEQNKVFYF
jgi:hypothetical protein